MLFLGLTIVTLNVCATYIISNSSESGKNKSSELWVLLKSAVLYGFVWVLSTVFLIRYGVFYAATLFAISFMLTYLVSVILRLGRAVLTLKLIMVSIIFSVGLYFVTSEH